MPFSIPTFVLILLAAFSSTGSCIRQPPPQRPDSLPPPLDSYSPVVSHLKHIIETNASFAAELHKVIFAGPDPNVTLPELYSFFDTWLTFLPHIDSVRQYLDQFGNYYITSVGDAFVRTNVSVEWIREFVMARGQYLDSAQSARVVKMWEDDPRIPMKDFIVPEGGFTSFNEFFTRKLQPGARHIDERLNPDSVTSPCDCTVEEIIPDLQTLTTLHQVKGESLNISLVFGGSKYAHAFEPSCSLAHLDLAATDYHHFHSPVSGLIVEIRDCGGLYFGPITFGEFFTQNRRKLIVIETPIGYVGVVVVGIATISSVEIAVSEGHFVEKGHELGHFAYGGSTILVVFEKSRLKQWEEEGKHVQVGNVVARGRMFDNDVLDD